MAHLYSWQRKYSLKGIYVNTILQDVSKGHVIIIYGWNVIIMQLLDLQVFFVSPFTFSMIFVLLCINMDTA